MACIEALSLVGGDCSEEVLISRVLQIDHDVEVICFAVKGLGMIKTPLGATTSVPLLLDERSGKDEKIVWRTASISLKEIGEASLDALEAHLSSGSSILRMRILDILSEMPGTRTDELLTQRRAMRRQRSAFPPRLKRRQHYNRLHRDIESRQNKSQGSASPITVDGAYQRHTLQVTVTATNWP